jgi:hypothetical protein
MQLKLQGSSVPLKAAASTSAKVTARRAVTIPAMSEKMIMCKLDEPLNDYYGLVEADDQCSLAHGVMVGRTLVNPADDQVPVLMANFSCKPKTIKEGTQVAICQGVQQTLEKNRASADQSVKLPDYLQDLFKRSSVHLNVSQKAQLMELLTSFTDVFSSGDTDLGCTDLVEHHINTGSHHPIKQPSRRVGPARRKEMEEALDGLIQQGVVERSCSPWTSAIVLVKKKDGSTRCCVDYRAVNNITVKDSYPLPRMDDILDSLIGATWFSTLDMKSGYHQVRVAKEDKPKTAFSFGQGLWQFRVMPFGLCNAPATFERLMERILEGLHWKTALVYLDDVIVYGSSFQQELQRLSEVFSRFRAANLRLNPKKCHLFQKEVSYLGHIVSEKGVRTDPDKVSAVKQWPEPTCVNELRSFLGLCSYYRKFVKNFATIAAPLHNLMKKEQTFTWSTGCQQAFNELKRSLCTAPVLPYPDPTRPYILDCDASAYGIGGVLSQKHNDIEFVVAYFSNSLSQPERNYCVTRRELLAMIKSLNYFHPYLYGSSFTIRTDHSALRWLKTLKNPEGQMARWIGKLDQYNYDIEHRPGQVHGNADSLSRRPCEPVCQHCCKRETLSTMCSRTIVSDNQVLSEMNIEDMQSEDKDLQPIMRCMKDSSIRPAWEKISTASLITKNYWAQWDVMRLSNGLLQRKWVTPDGIVKYWQTVLPKNMRKEVLRETHDSLAGGHLGVKKTLSRLRQRFYWIGMRQDVEEWCRSCDVCCAKKGPKRHGRAPLQLYQVGSPMERVAVDIAGPLTMTTSGNRYICVAMDYFTKWPEAYAIPNQEATTIASILVDQFFSRFGMPNELHSDQGRNFESAVFKGCCELLGIHKTRTTPMRPQSDGMVEKFNWTLGQELAKYCTEGQTEWDRKLPALLMAYRSAEHESTGYSPAKIMLGHELRLPLDLLTGRPPDEELPGNPQQFVKELQENLAEVHHQVRENLKFTGNVMKRYHDVKAHKVCYTESDRVWFYNPQRKKGQSPKLMSPWEGPYTVVDRLSDVTFRIKGGPRAKCKVVHANRLWKYHGPGHYTWTVPVAEPASSDADDETQRVEDLDSCATDQDLQMSQDSSERTDVIPVQEDAVELRRSSRQRRKPEKFGDFVTYT